MGINMNLIPEIEEVADPHNNRKYAKKCNCSNRCDKFYRVNGFDVYCKGVLEQLSINILNMVNGTKIAQGNRNNRGWTTKQEQQIIQFIEQNGVRFGTYRIIGEMIGKPRESVKRKVYMLEKEGRLKRM